MSKKRYRLSHTRLSRRLPDSWIPFSTSDACKGAPGAMGQARALRAIDFGLQIPDRGFNLFVVGAPGAGKTSMLTHILRERAERGAVPQDLCYVADFEARERPRPLRLPPGRGRVLAKDMERIVLELTTLVPRALSEGAFGHLRAGLLADARARMETINAHTKAVAERLGVRIEEEEGELQVIPLVAGEPMDAEAYESLSSARRRKIEKNILAFQEHLERNAYAKQQLERRTADRLRQTEVRVIAPMVEQLFQEVTRAYRGLPAVREYLEAAQAYVLGNHREFLPDEAGEGEGADAKALMARYRRFQVNVVVDRTGQKGAPVVTERLPSTDNLTGYFEYRREDGSLSTDHTLIRAGALHRANGGYLLLQATDLFAQEGAWDCLKGALRHREIRIEPPATVSGEGRPRIAGAMKPEAVPLDVKVILVGSSEYYYTLKLDDEDFGRLFKIKAEFGAAMPRNRETVQDLGRFLAVVCREEGHLPLHASGFARLVEHASRVVDHQDRLTTDRAGMLDVLAEASFRARQRRARAIRRRDVDAALSEHRLRHDAAAGELDRMIREGTILIRTKGSAVAQINGIALYDLAGVSFGIPVRITARIYAGRGGVVNIDREVDLSGSIHDKGALILVGYLGGRYAQDQTLGLSASITFEQSYDEIDGDSASSAELYAMLSALSGCPIRLGIAVTGSVNQLGEVQPIGGVNDKIEGIFRVAKSRGLNGHHGVLIPKTNTRHLMLDREVIDACRRGLFHIYAVSSVDEGIEVLTGVPAGRRRKDGTWSPGSINDLVQRRLAELQQVVRHSGVTTPLDRDL